MKNNNYNIYADLGNICDSRETQGKGLLNLGKITTLTKTVLKAAQEGYEGK